MQRSTLWRIIMLSVTVVFLLVFCFAAFASDSINDNGFLQKIGSPKAGSLTNSFKQEVGYNNNIEAVIEYVQPTPMLSTDGITRGEFIAEIVAYFGWPHWDEYNDIWKDDPKTFNDIDGHKHQRAIETALEERIVGPKDYVGQRSGSDGAKEWGRDVVGSFNPDNPLTREDAAIMLARAYKLDVSNTTLAYDDINSFSSNEAKGSVAALIALDGLSFFGDAIKGDFNPKGPIDKVEALNLLNEMKLGVVAPVYFAPRPTAGYAPRRNIKLYTANPAAEIYVSRSNNTDLDTANYGEANAGHGTEPADPTPNKDLRYSEYHISNNDKPYGYLGYDISGTNPVPTAGVNERKYPIIKAIAVDNSKDLKQESEVSRGEWKIWRPALPDSFQHEQIFEKNHFYSGSPAVYRVFERSDGVLSMAWYVEGTDKAIVSDALHLYQENEEKVQGMLNLKEYIVQHVATPGHPVKINPEDNLYLVIGHTHTDHMRQTYSFEGHYIYAGSRAKVAGGTAFRDQLKEKYADRYIVLENGDQLDLGGGVVLDTYLFPNHSLDSIVLHDKKSGMIFGSDVCACARAGSIDDVAISSINNDLFLSIVQQNLSKMREGGAVPFSYIFTGHDDTPLPGEAHWDVYTKALQLIIDEGEINVTHPTYRNVRRPALNRSVTYGNAYPDSPSGLMPMPLLVSQIPEVGEQTPTMEIPEYRKYRNGQNWVTFTTGGSYGTTGTTLSSYQTWNNVDAGMNYNTDDNYKKYAQLSNIEFIGAELVGVDLQFGADATPAQLAVDPNYHNKLFDMFDPWTYEYDIIVPDDAGSIGILPTTISSNSNLKVNGETKTRGEWTTLNVSLGDTIEVEVTSADGSVTKTYTFTVTTSGTGSIVPADLNSATAVSKPGESNQLPLQGYFKANLTADGFTDREIRYYLPETAILRPYYHFIAIPNGVNVDEFIVSSGWKQIADETGECLYILMPKNGTWSTNLEDEKGYVAAARAFHQTNPKGLTTFGLYYLIGYGAGAASLEAWAAENPHLVIAQSYVDATASAGTATLEAAGAVSFGWKQMTDGDWQNQVNRNLLDRITPDGKQKILIQMANRLKDILNPNVEGFEGLLTKGDMPVPTWLVNAPVSEDSMDYWKKVNKATGDTADSTTISFGGQTVPANVFNQKEDTWPTEYAGCISKVTSMATTADTISYTFSKALRNEMTDYTRYDSSIGYGNALNYRLDYTAVQVERFAADNTSKKATAEVTGLGLDGYPVKGEVTIDLLQVQNNTTTVVPADMILYVPESAGNANIPVVIVSHGGSQNAHLFLDSTMWWQTAAKEGFAVVLTTRTAMGGAGAPAAAANLPVFDATISYLEADGRFDMTRVYATGQSAGGSATISYAENRSDNLAAAHGQASGTPDAELGGKAIPVGFIVGEGNYGNRAIPGYVADTYYETDFEGAVKNNVRSTAAAAAGADIYWDPENSMTNIQKWMAYFNDANGINMSNLSSVIRYRGGNTLNGGYDNEEGALREFDKNNARYRTFTWYKDAEENLPIMEYTFVLYEAHNNIPGHDAIIWDFMKHYKVVDNGDGTVTRYYSPSGFKQDDAVDITKKSSLSVEDIQSIQGYADAAFYGQSLVEVKITYKDGVDLSGVNADTYILEDRGSLNPDFGQVKIKGVSVEGQVVTLSIWDDTYATDINSLVYTGSGAGARQRNAFGIFATGAWYRGVDGKIYYGNSDTDEYENNTTGKGYQIRERLDLKLRHSGEVASNATQLTNVDGSYNTNSLWEETIHRNLGEGGFQTFEQLGIKVPSTSATATDGTGDDYVKGWVHIPESYTGDKPVPIVFTLQGQGISYWKLPDGTNNEGCGLMYDTATFSWMDTGVIAVNIHDRSNNGTGGNVYDFVADDVAVMKYFIDNYNIDTSKIILHGNSRGTAASNEVIKALTGQPYKSDTVSGQLDKDVYDFTIGYYLCHNGSFGGGSPIGNAWNAEDRAAIAKSGLKAWVIDGEQDSNNITSVADMAEAYKAVGFSDAWIKENLRLTGLSSEMFAYWGETDHSATRLNYWYFSKDPYYGPDYKIVNGQLTYNTKLNPGDTYEVPARGSAATSNKVGYKYTVYAESHQDWILSGSGEPDFNLQLTMAIDDDKLTLTTFFKNPVNSNAAILDFRFDVNQFQFVDFIPAGNVNMINAEPTDTGARVTVMVMDYNTTAYGDLNLKAKGAISSYGKIETMVTADYVIKDVSGGKTVKREVVSTFINPPPPPDPITYDLITLSDMIDVFGMDSTHPDWNKIKRFDLIEDGQINIDDIALFASRIGKE